MIVIDVGLFKFGVVDIIVGYFKDVGVDSYIFLGVELNLIDINVYNGVIVYNE